MKNSNSRVKHQAPAAKAVAAKQRPRDALAAFEARADVQAAFVRVQKAEAFTVEGAYAAFSHLVSDKK